MSDHPIAIERRASFHRRLADMVAKLAPHTLRFELDPEVATSSSSARTARAPMGDQATDDRSMRRRHAIAVAQLRYQLALADEERRR